MGDAVDEVQLVWRELYSVGVLEVVEVGDLEGWAGGGGREGELCGGLGCELGDYWQAEG